MVGRICKWAYMSIVKGVCQRSRIIRGYVYILQFTIFIISWEQTMGKMVFNTVPEIFWNSIS